MKRNSVFLRLVSLALACIVMISAGGVVADASSITPYASSYLTSYNTYICAMGSGDLQIWFTVVGDTDMDDIGTLSIMLYESTDNINWSWKKTFLHEDYEQMLISGIVNSDYVPYDGVAGRYYKAYVCIYAGIGNNGDSRYMWTSVERAT